MNGLKPWENARAWGKMKRLQAENARLKAKIDHLTPPLWLRVVAWLVSFVGAFCLAELVLKWMNR